MVLNDVHAEVDEFEPTSYGGVIETNNQRNSRFGGVIETNNQRNSRFGGVIETDNQRRVRSEQGFGGEE